MTSLFFVVGIGVVGCLSSCVMTLFLTNILFHQYEHRICGVFAILIHGIFLRIGVSLINCICEENVVLVIRKTLMPMLRKI